MRRYDKEFEFLSKVEDKTDISNERIKYSVEQVKELKEKHIHIPDEYTDYLMEIGAGSFRECQFNVFGWLEPIESIFGKGNYGFDEKILFFADNFSGDLSGFIVDQNWELIEYWHDCNEIHYTKKSFHQFIKEKMLMDNEGNDIMDY